MVKENLEAKAIKAVLNIDGKITDIKNVLRDISMKLCHIIRYKRVYYGLPDAKNCYK